MTELKLRPELRIEECPHDARFPARLVDPVFEQRIKLDAEGLALVRALAAEGDAPLSDDTGTRERLEGLRNLLVLDDELSRAALAHSEAVERWRSGPLDEVRLIHAPAARFSCTGCGGCCGGHNIGPVDDHVREALSSEQGLALLARQGLDGRDPYTDTRVLGWDEEDAEVVALRNEAGSCVLLDADLRCSLHAAMGAEAKPSTCRIFPFVPVVRPDGVAMSLQMECRDILAATANGAPYADQADDLRALARFPHGVRSVRPVVVVDGLATLACEDYASEVRDPLLAAASAASAPLPALIGLREVIEGRGRPRARGRGASVSRLEGLGELRDTLYGAVMELGRSLVNLRRELLDEDEERVVRLHALERLLAALSTLVPRLEQVLAAPRDPEALRLFRLLVENALYGEDLSRARSLRWGATLLTLRWLLARAVAVDRAWEAKRPEPNAQDHVDGLVAVSFALRSKRTADLLVEGAAPLSLLFYDHLADIVEHAPALAQPDRRAEVILN